MYDTVSSAVGLGRHLPLFLTLSEWLPAGGQQRPLFVAAVPCRCGSDILSPVAPEHFRTESTVPPKSMEFDQQADGLFQRTEPVGPLC